MLPECRRKTVANGRSGIGRCVKRVCIGHTCDCFRLFAGFNSLPVIAATLPSVRNRLIRTDGHRPHRGITHFVVRSLGGTRSVLLGGPPNNGGHVSGGMTCLLRTHMTLCRTA